MPRRSSSHADPSPDWGLEPNPKNVYLVSQRDGSWVVERQQAKRVTSTHDTKTEAVERALDLAERKQAMLLVYKGNGEHHQTYRFPESATA